MASSAVDSLVLAAQAFVSAPASADGAALLKQLSAAADALGRYVSGGGAQPGASIEQALGALTPAAEANTLAILFLLCAPSRPPTLCPPPPASARGLRLRRLRRGPACPQRRAGLGRRRGPRPLAGRSLPPAAVRGRAAGEDVAREVCALLASPILSPPRAR